MVIQTDSNQSDVDWEVELERYVGFNLHGDETFYVISVEQEEV